MNLVRSPTVAALLAAEPSRNPEGGGDRWRGWMGEGFPRGILPLTPDPHEGAGRKGGESTVLPGRARSEPVDVDLRERGFDVSEQVEIPLLGQLRMVPALHEDLSPAKRDGFLDLAVHLRVGNHVGIVILLRAVERAKLAINIADVR